MSAARLSFTNDSRQDVRNNSWILRAVIDRKNEGRSAMKKLKKVITILLAMVMTMSVTVFAADNKGSLTIRVNKDNSLENQTIKLYKLFDLTTDGTHDAYTVNSQYEPLLKKVLNLSGENLTSNDYYQAILKKEEGSEEIQDFANQFAEEALSKNATETRISKQNSKGTTEVTFDNLDYGYYLVYQSGTKKIQASLVSVDDTENEVYLKGQSPDITKTEDVTTVDIGQTIDYTITGTIPDTTGYSQYQYLIEDTLTEGLDYDGNVTVTVIDPKGTPTTAPSATIKGRTFELDLSEWVRENQENAGKTFKVTYKAIVNQDAVVTENNQAYLEYGNDPESITKTTPREVKSPTYPLQIKKTDNEGTTMLAGATFKLYKNEEDANNGKNAITVTKKSEGKYVYDTNVTDTEMTSIDQKVDHVTADCNLYLNGLEAGSYYLVETKAPDGYNKISAPIEIIIHRSTDEDDETKWTLTANNGNVNGQVLTVKNNSGAILPSTGGRGTIIFAVIAGILILGVGISFAKDKKREA